ncbi:porin [Pseudoalteromonas sp. T1lg22]|uniref:porin n=1 Tax=Pseudoalteromonas sp. T1lg22 TaxID=2077096 RepID=UPI000CF6BBFD|nr:porin [Pseudoalteromonas sp. T1lg22]
MIKQLTFTSAAMLMAGATTAHAADYDIYGKAEVQIAHTDKGVMRYTEEGTQIDAPFSRIGVKGQHALNDTTQLVFKYEVQVKGFDGDSTNDPFSARNTYVGVQSQYGTVLVGRNDTRFKYSEGKVDQFNETQGDIAQVLAGQSRVGDSITYSTPKFGLWAAAVTWVPKDDSNSEDNGVAALLSYGDRALKRTPYFVALSYSDALGDLQATRVTAAYRWQQLQLGAIVQRSENLAGDKEGDGLVLSARYWLSDAWQPKLQYSRDDSGLRHEGDAEQFTVGVDYVVDKQTTFYLLASQLELDTSDDTSTALGLKYMF